MEKIKEKTFFCEESTKTGSPSRLISITAFRGIFITSGPERGGRDSQCGLVGVELVTPELI